MIDLHCHVLPAIDDGPDTVEASVAMAREAFEDGTTVIAATPHVDLARPEIDADRIANAVAALQPALDDAGVDVRIVAGAEVAGIRAVELSDDELQRLTLGAGPWLLLECPLSTALIPGFVPLARSLGARGHQLLLAHPERSPLFLRHPEQLEELIAGGALVQVTAGALTGRFGRTVREAALKLLHRGNVHVIASDGHGNGRPAVMSADLEQAGVDPELAAWLTHDVPRALLAGQEVPSRPQIAAPPARRGGRLARLIGR